MSQVQMPYYCKYFVVNIKIRVHKVNIHNKKFTFTTTQVTHLLYIFRLVNPDFMIINYHLELTPNSYEMIYLLR
jgi:hypothetical protein